MGDGTEEILSAETLAAETLTAETKYDWLAGGGEMAKVVAWKDWSQTPLGPIESWPQSLRTTVSLCLASNFPISIAWGPQRIQIYNDGYWPICAAKHPHSMGQDFKECWFSAWPVIGQAFEEASNGETRFLVNQRMFLDRLGFLEETFFTFSFSPIRDESGGVAGLFHPVTELTQQSLAERRLRILRDMADASAEATSVEGALSLIADTLAANEFDVPFALLYRIDQDGSGATLARSTGMAPGLALSPISVTLDSSSDAVWPLGQASISGTPIVVSDLAPRFELIRCGPYEEPPASAIVQQILLPGLTQPFGVLVCGVSARRPLDEAYRTFYAMLGEAVTNALAKARAYEEERKRAEALAELDRAKTAFFSNVSHEFRTPLTLMLGPLEELLRTQEAGSVAHRDLALVHRNSLRLLKLVNALLNFSRIEAGRVQATYVPTDVAAFTAELAGVFRSAIEQAGLRLLVDCPPLSEPAYVDRDMWEKIVLNLISNAFKFTFSGDIRVSLSARDGDIELVVQDTGIGIPDWELSRVFDRFHRVEGAEGRTHEGTGIGLALVQELARLHGGCVQAESLYGKGSTFRVRIPQGTAHLPADRIEAATPAAAPAPGAAAFVEEALGWLPSGIETMGHQPSAEVPGAELEDDSRFDTASQAPTSSGTRPRILIADDNADMRDYLRRLLDGQYEVETVADGRAALAAARARPPDVILSDVMMPRLDGVGLLHELRRDPAIRTIPVILLSARAGEEARVEGLEEGADDYLIKPFSARELLARVGAHVNLVRVREEAQRATARSQRFLERLAASTPDLLFVFDILAGKNIYLNRRVESMLGYGVEGVEAVPDDLCHALVHPDDQADLAHWFAQFDAAPDQAVLEQTCRMRHADGSYRWLCLRATTYERTADGRTKQIIGVAVDITGRKHREAELIVRSRQQAALYKFAEAVNRAEALSDLYEKALDTIVPSLKADRASILLFDEEGVMRFTASRGLSEEYRRAVEGHSPWQRDAIDPQPIIVGDVSAAAIEASLLAVIRREGIQALAFIPLMYGGRLIGKFMVYFNSIHVMTSDQASLAQAIAGTLALGIERKTAELRLRESEEQFRTAFQWASVGKAQVDVLTKRFIAVNQAYCRMTGYSPEELLRLRPEDLTHPDDREADLRGFMPLLRGETDKYVTEKRYVTKDGSIIWVLVEVGLIRNAEGKPWRTIAMILDISERKRTEQALHLSEERFRLATAAGKVGVWDWDIVHNAVSWTQSLYGVHGVAPGEVPMTVEGFSTLVHSDDRERVAQALEATLKTDAPYELEFRSQRPDGQVIWLFTNAVVLREEGRPVRMLGASVDITPTKRAAEQLKAWSEELERCVHERTEELQLSQERLRALATELNLAEQRERTRLAADLHDYLAQMLVLARLKLGQAKRISGLAPRHEDLITQAEDVLGESLSYTRTLVADLSPSVLYEYGLTPALRWLAERMKRHDLTVTVEAEEHGALPEAHGLLLFQSVRELLMNVSKHAQVQEAWVRLRCSQNVLVLEVRDAGSGFDAEASLKNASQAATFGLFSIRERMRAIGGSLELESASGRGTRARLVLPLAGGQGQVASGEQAGSGTVPSETAGGQPSTAGLESEDSALLTPHASHANPSPPSAACVADHAVQSPIRVLLVDDHAMVRQGLRSILESYADIEVVGEAFDGEEAVAAVERLRPAVVVMDINMPKVNGVEAARKMKAQHPEMPIIGLSVDAEGENQAAMIAAGATMLLTKEAAFDELYGAILQVLRRDRDREAQAGPR